MKPKIYQVLQLAVEDGVKLGVRRALRHSDQPGEDYIVFHTTEAVLNSVCEWFDLEPNNEP